jgi:hypothetical protein
MVPQEEAGGQEGKGEDLPGGPSLAAGLSGWAMEKRHETGDTPSCVCFSLGFNMDQCAMARALPLK